MVKIIPLSLKLDFTPNTLGFYRLSSSPVLPSYPKQIWGKVKQEFVFGVFQLSMKIFSIESRKSWPNRRPQNDPGEAERWSLYVGHKKTQDI